MTDPSTLFPEGLRPPPVVAMPDTPWRSVVAALRRCSPVIVDAGPDIRCKLLRRYADLSERNCTLAIFAWALLLFGLIPDVALLPKALLFSTIAGGLLWRRTLARRLRSTLRPSHPHSNPTHDALIVLAAAAWGLAPWICVDLLGTAHAYGVQYMALGALAVTAGSYIPALPVTVLAIGAGITPVMLFLCLRGDLESAVLGVSSLVFGLSLLARMSASHSTLMQALRTEQQNGELVAELQDLRMALELENAALGSSLRDAHHAADRDALTGLFNRRYLTSVGASLREQLQGHGEPVTLCMFDVDHFKRVNDRCGHAAGDQVLRTIAQAVAGSLRDPDLVARFGGEEFIAVLRRCDLAQAERVAEQLRKGVAEARIDTDAGPISVTVSIGLAQWHRAESFDALIKRADRALYAAKRKGRNCIEIDAPDVDAGTAPPRARSSRPVDLRSVTEPMALELELLDAGSAASAVDGGRKR